MSKPKLPKKLEWGYSYQDATADQTSKKINELIDRIEWLMDRHGEDVHNLDDGMAPSSKPQEPEYCCDLFKSRMKCGAFYRAADDDWVIKQSFDILSYCPFCGKKLK